MHTTALDGSLTDAGAGMQRPVELSYAMSFLLMSFPGATQGATTVLLGHPLDTAKVRMQAAGPNTTRSTFGTICSMVRTEGARSLYRGVTPPLLMEGTKRSAQFAFWGWLRWTAEVHQQVRDTTHAHAPETLVESIKQFGARCAAYIGNNNFLSGAVAGGVGTLIGCPMHVIKIQTQCRTAQETRNAWTCMGEIHHKEGILGFYRGFHYNVAKDFCFAGAYLGLYAKLRDHPWFTISGGGSVDARWPMRKSTTTHVGAFCSGALAAMATWTLLYPLDTIKTLAQAKQAGAIPTIVRQPSLLYRGLGASLMKAGPVSGVSMAVYECACTFQSRWMEKQLG